MSVVDRFLRYVQIDTTSREGVDRVPSTEGQWDLARLLADELRTLGATNIRLSEHCMLQALLPANVDYDVPCVGLIAHLDTSPAVSGANVRPVVHRNYQGGDIVLPGDPTQVLSPARTPILETMIGDDIITSDGTTLLGSDDKAGIAAIMELVARLQADPAIPHGPIAVAFTADEEVGGGIDCFDIDAFGASFAYTVDGETLGEINDETWHARGATVTFTGVSAHPGKARGALVNPAYAMAHFLTLLPPGLRAEHTDGREGFVHPHAGSFDAERATVSLLLRDFTVDGLDLKERALRECAQAAAAAVPGTTVAIDVQEQYRNMREGLDAHPRIVAWALNAARRAGLEARTAPIRGGTDGARLTFRGLPCPNIFTGGHNFHSTTEFNSRRGLEKTTETLVHLVQVIAAAHAPGAASRPDSAVSAPR